MEQKTKTAKKNDCGALWIKKSKQGNTFLAGQVTTSSGETVKIVVFKNSYKQEGSNAPDYRIYLEESPVSKKEDAPVVKKEVKSVEPVAEDEIPF